MTKERCIAWFYELGHKCSSRGMSKIKYFKNITKQFDLFVDENGLWCCNGKLLYLILTSIIILFVKNIILQIYWFIKCHEEVKHT